VAEELVFGDVTNGARGDIGQATGISRRMVCEWGMSEKMGMVEYGEHEDYVFLGRDMHKNRNYSEATAQEIDAEVRKLCDDAYQRAKQLIGANREKLEIIAKALLEFETLDGDQVNDIMRQGYMNNPPARPKPPGVPPPLKTQRPEGETTIAPEIPPGLTGAPA
jgi:cell division protease FtsH